MILVTDATTNIVFVVDASSDVTLEEIEAIKNLINNLVKTLEVTDINAKYSLITFGKSPKLLVPFKKSVDETFSLEDITLDIIGGPRNVDKALDFVDNDIFNARSGFLQKIINGVVFVFTTGNFNGIRNQQLNIMFEKLSNRNVDTVFVDTLNGRLDVPFRDILTNISTEDVKSLPSLLPKLSTLLGRSKGKSRSNRNILSAFFCTVKFIFFKWKPACSYFPCCLSWYCPLKQLLDLYLVVYFMVTL